MAVKVEVDGGLQLWFVVVRFNVMNGGDFWWSE